MKIVAQELIYEMKLTATINLIMLIKNQHLVVLRLYKPISFFLLFSCRPCVLNQWFHSSRSVCYQLSNYA